MEEQCPKCHGTGRVQDPDGMIHTCWDCLASGKLNTHSSDVKNFKEMKV